ncbi:MULTISPECIES: phenylacetate--CoA ligase [Thermodesulfovibrio]|uniref:Phenylacetate-coenzyme A ligase n=1 Tax=Thermodesulfovibrio yellowstonii (strain ATCC 51303 / DSM 11347 / YP87) TaxID=289376 RepID=B5YGU8_THEYD|nr:MULTISPECIES: phenylacetate--CoA ligase [Thermodesulfovibrio]ACI20519.1 phenylacetate-coenzyme A ligase [Thermodesulfovibrio yellowstonii DSM 11347]
MFNPEKETLPREEIEKLQLTGLRKTLRFLKNSRSKLKEKYRDIEPEDIRSLDDLKSLSFVTKDDLRDCYPFGHIAVEPSDCARMHMSSGTTGVPVINAMTKNDIAQWGEIMARCLAAAGLTEKDKLQIMPSFGLFNGGFGFHYGAERLGCFIVPAGAGRSLMQLKLIKDLGVTAFGAIASYPARLIEVAKDNGFDFRETKLRAAILGAETWSDEYRRRIEGEMGIKTFDIIGLTETGGVGLGIDCERKTGIHIWEDHYIVEIIDPETEKPLSIGEEGEMVITTLTREGLPLIRYRTRDISKILSYEKCDCGRTHIRVSRIRGRTDDMLKVKGVNFYPSQVEQILLKHKGLSSYYQLVIETAKGKDEMTIIVEKADNGITQRELDQLDLELYDFLGFHSKIQVVPEGTIQRVPGKAVRIIDKRKKV